MIRPLELVLEIFFYYILYPFIYLSVFVIVGYRKKVIRKNLENSFPGRSKEELKKISNSFKLHFIDLLIEGILMLTLSERTLMQKFIFENPELIDDYYKKGRSVILVGGHQNNWEYLVCTLNKQFLHQGSGIGKKIANSGVSKLMNDRRSRFGMEVWDAENVRQKFGFCIASNRLFCCLMLADQSVHNVESSFWMEFMHQNTPVYYGPEYFAKKYDLPIVYYSCKKSSRGVYRCTLELVSDHPGTEAYGDITFRHNKLLERDIKEFPQHWLWTHKRWKHAHKAPVGAIRKV